jgi:hypothetical protein
MIYEFNTVFHYDSMPHAFFLGFTFSMIFAHAPIIFPGVAGLNMKPFHGSLYVWGMALQVTIALRMAADLLFLPKLRTQSGMLSAIVILLFFINLAILIITQQRKKLDIKR